MIPDLVFDVGMHKGYDAEFYLRKGFRVVGIEADPELARVARDRLNQFVELGRLVILNTAIGESDGVVSFYANRHHDDWGTMNDKFRCRNQLAGSNHHTLEVSCSRFESIIEEFGTPYFLKIDIEGSDHLCLESLLQVKSRPKFISIEASETYGQARYQLSLLKRLGYQKFKIINQALNESLCSPDPPREGSYVDQTFSGLTSGLFGEESPGCWEPHFSVQQRYRVICWLQYWFGVQGVKGRLAYNRVGEPSHVYRLLRAVVGREILGWYDFHAKLE